jgi:predicted Zn-dependent protease
MHPSVVKRKSESVFSRENNMKAIISILLLAAAALAAAGCETNPATGEKQLIFISEEQEISLGASAVPDVEKEMGGVYSDPELTAYVNQVGQSLAAQSERPTLPWTFKIVDTNDVNAFALPGGYIYVTKGLLKQMGNEAQLACVLGHEIGHVTAKHSVNQLQKAVGFEIFAAAVGAGTGSQDAEAVAKVAMALLQLKYGRNDEYKADELGVRYANRLNYNPDGMIQLFGIFLELGSGSGGTVGEIFSTHPDTQKRIDRITKFLNEKYPDAVGDPAKMFNEAEYKAAISSIH